MATHTSSVDALAAAIPDGALVAMPPDYAGGALTVVRALIARGARDLCLLGVPQLGLAADWLIGAGCVAEVESAAFTLGETGTAPRFAAAVRAGTLKLRDSTCPAIHAALQASEKGIPYLPLRGLLGSDLVRHRPDWQVADNPFAGQPGDRIVLLPAIRPDVSLIHAPLADRDGNVFVGVRREMMLMAHASRRTLATAERIVDDNLLEDPARAAGVIPALYVESVVEAPRGAWPLGLWGEYAPDAAHVSRYASAARSDEGFAAYQAEHLAVTLVPA